MSFERILVPTDFSECAEWALEQAIAIAKQTNGRIDLVHSDYVPNLHEVVAPPDVLRTIRTTALSRLATLVKRVEEAGVDVQQHLADETPTLAIQRLAEKQNSDCIVMGTRGLTGLQHVVLGSTAERALRTAPCPVLTVGQPLREGHELPQKILVPTDFSEAAERAIAIARGLLAKQGDAEIVLVHIYANPIAAGPYAFAASDGFLGIRARILNALEDTAEEFRKAGFRASVRVEEARSASREIARVARETDCDWIVLGTHGRTGFSHLALGSIAERVVREAVCPTLTIKADDQSTDAEPEEEST